MTQTAKITRDDLEAKLREISGEVERSVQNAQPKVTGAVVGAGVVVILLAYLLGRRRGRKRAAVVEIRRI